MKKILLCLVILSLVLSNQSMAQAGFRVGIKGGLNFSDLSVGNSINDIYDTRTGYHAGAFATIKLTKLAIQPEIIYSSQGASFSGDVGSQTFKGLKQEFSYLNIPIMMKLYLVGGLNLQVGPQFGFLLRAKSEKDVFEQVTESEDLKDAYEGSDLSLALGAGIDLPFGLTIDARYNLGLKDVNAHQALQETKNQVFQVSLGYRLIELGK